jgi:DNA-binding transcriptional regulator/RsmH inhibitor MraZ
MADPLRQPLAHRDDRGSVSALGGVLHGAHRMVLGARNRIVIPKQHREVLGDGLEEVVVGPSPTLDSLTLFSPGVYRALVHRLEEAKTGGNEHAARLWDFYTGRYQTEKVQGATKRIDLPPIPGGRLPPGTPVWVVGKGDRLIVVDDARWQEHLRMQDAEMVNNPERDRW